MVDKKQTNDMSLIKYLILTGVTALLPYLKLGVLILSAFLAGLVVFLLLLEKELAREIDKEIREKNEKLAKTAALTEEPEAPSA